MPEKFFRRQFLKGAVAATSLGPLLKASGALPAGERIRLGFIGCGGRGRGLMKIFLQFPGVEIPAISDVIEPRMEQALEFLAREARPQKPEHFVYHERLLERKDIDAVVIATTQHWHGLPHIHACQAGKPIYVEKPLSHTVVEGRAMVEAAKKHGVMALMGSQQRGGDHWKKAVQLIQAGRLGRIPLAECWNYRDEGARVGRHADSEPPPGYHWDRWLGPAPKVPFNPGRLRNAWWMDYSGGILTNWAVHHIDSIIWAMKAPPPTAVSCSGGKFVIDDMADTPDTLEATWEFPGWVMQYRYRGYNNFRPFLSRPKAHGLCFHGTRATMILDRDGYEIWDDGQFDSWTENPREPVERVANVPYFPAGIGNESDGEWQKMFLQCLRDGKKPPVDLEESHRATACCQLANISYLTGRKLHWDGRNETIRGDEEATRLLHRPRRRGYELPEI